MKPQVTLSQQLSAVRFFRSSTKFLFSVFMLASISACGGGSGSSSSSAPDDELSSAVLRWNQIAIDASGIDHQAGSGRHQLGPTRSSRAMAIVHIAIFDAANAVTGSQFRSYAPGIGVDTEASAQAAVAKAARDTLAHLYETRTADFDALLAEDLSAIPDGLEKDAGIAIGAQSALQIIEIRTNDGSEQAKEHAFSNEIGTWTVDPLNPNQGSLGHEWKDVIPFTMSDARQFRLPPPPALNSPEYAEAFAEVVRLGGDGVITPTERTEEQTEIGIFWAYDGTPSLCAPPRLYNQVAIQVATDQGTSGIELARLLALLNVSMADSAIAAWDSKYFYDLWRPVVAVRLADLDGNPLTTAIPDFTPLGAPASNLAGTDFTPPFPAYPSGHATFGGALFQTLRNFYGSDSVGFSFVSDEFNGTTQDSNGITRPFSPRSYSSFSEAEEENGQSRIYLGIHWSFDKTSGIEQGNNVANFVAQNVFQPLN